MGNLWGREGTRKATKYKATKQSRRHEREKRDTRTEFTGDVTAPSWNNQTILITDEGIKRRTGNTKLRGPLEIVYNFFRRLSSTRRCVNHDKQQTPSERTSIEEGTSRGKTAPKANSAAQNNVRRNENKMRHRQAGDREVNREFLEEKTHIIIRKKTT